MVCLLMVCLLCDFKILLTVFNQSYNCQTSHYTEVRYVSFLSDGFITGIVVNPPERKLAKRTYVHYLGRNWLPKPFLIFPSLVLCIGILNANNNCRFFNIWAHINGLLYFFRQDSLGVKKKGNTFNGLREKAIFQRLTSNNAYA